MAEDTIILPSQPKKYHFRAHVFLYQTVDYFHVHLKGNEEIWIQIELHFGQSSHVLISNKDWGGFHKTNIKSELQLQEARRIKYNKMRGIV